MDKRLRLGLVYLWDESWLGGYYYVLNLLRALDTLSDDRKPFVRLYCLKDEAFDHLKADSGYEYLEKTIVRKLTWKMIIRKLMRYLIHEKADNINIFNTDIDGDLIYPLSEGRHSDKMVYWIQDFQDKYLPEMFLAKSIKYKDYVINSCCKRGIPVVLSSKDAQDDFRKFYPDFKEHTTYVVHFAASQPDFGDVDIDAVRQKYGINKRYLFCANQFWKHKNHLFLFKAFKKALDKGLDLQLVCSGNMTDFRNPEYTDVLKSFIASNNLESRILTLGMIDKKELLCLMKNSYAVVQPSLFEGWNTTVEDCKAMSKFIFLSNLKVHQEQMDKNVCFFDPCDEDGLADKLLTVEPKEEVYDYSRCINEFGETIYNLMVSRSALK